MIIIAFKKLEAMGKFTKCVVVFYMHYDNSPLYTITYEADWSGWIPSNAL